MNRIRHLRGPRLDTNLKTDDNLSTFGQVLMQTAQRGFDRNERKRKTDLNEKYRRDALSQNQDNANRNYELQKDTLDWNKTKHQQTIDANAALVKTKYPDVTKNIGLQYGQYPSKENAKSFHNVLGNIDVKHLEPKTKTFKTFEGVGKDGSPTIYTLDNTGNITNTGVSAYTPPKGISPERQAYYQARNEELQQKRLNNMIKNIDLQYPGIGEDERLKAINYINEKGQMPIIKYDNGWGFFRPNSWGGRDKGYYVSMDKNSKTKAQKQLEKDMKLLGL